MPATTQTRFAPLKRLFIDVSTIVRHDAGTGIQRVVRSVCNELARQHEYELDFHPVAATRWQNYTVVSTPLLPSRGRVPDGSLELQPGDAFFGLDLTASLLPARRRQLRRWARGGARLGFIIYDLLPYQHPSWFGRRTAPHFRRWLDTVGQAATHVFPISASVAADFDAFMATHHPSRREEVVSRVVPLSGDIGKFEQGDASVDHAVLSEMRSQPALLMVGTVEPRKGHDLALRAHRQARAISPQAPLLVFVGRAGWHTDRLQAEMRSLSLERDGAVWLEEVSDPLLDRLYRSCTGLLVASLGEGYCLPVREAQAYCKPVLARDLPVLKELDSSAVRYFSAADEDRLGQMILDFVGSERPAAAIPAPCGWKNTLRSMIDAFSE